MVSCSGSDVTLSQIRNTSFCMIHGNNFTRSVIDQYVICKGLKGQFGTYERWIFQDK